MGSLNSVVVFGWTSEYIAPWPLKYTKLSTILKFKAQKLKI